MYKGAMRGQNKRVGLSWVRMIELNTYEKKQKRDPTQNFAKIKEKKEHDKKNLEEAMKHHEKRDPKREE